MEQTRLEKDISRRYTWTGRHWWPVVGGAVSSVVYALILRELAKTAIFLEYYQLQGWEIPVTAQLALFAGAYCTRLMMFDK